MVLTLLAQSNASTSEPLWSMIPTAAARDRAGRRSVGSTAVDANSRHACVYAPWQGAARPG
jgi:hypothetical protein